MELELARYWWLVALRGVLAILFGVVAFFWPGLVWLFVVATFAVYALVDGFAAIMAGVSVRGQGGRWALFLEGFIGVVAGVLALGWPDITELALLYLIAGWSIATGVFEIAAAVGLHRYIPGALALGLSGVLSILLGFALGLAPVAGLIVVAWWIGAFSIAFGALLVVLGVQLRSLVRHAPQLKEPSMSRGAAPVSS